jgi:hypothetical protein
MCILYNELDFSDTIGKHNDTACNLNSINLSDFLMSQIIANVTQTIVAIPYLQIISLASKASWTIIDTASSLLKLHFTVVYSFLYFLLKSFI